MDNLAHRLKYGYKARIHLCPAGDAVQMQIGANFKINPNEYMQKMMDCVEELQQPGRLAV